MKKTFSLIVIIFAAFRLIAQQLPITADILRQTFIIQTIDKTQGTCFLVEMDNQEYLITAKHLFRTKIHNGDSARIVIYQENKEINLSVQFYVHKDTTIDIAVLKLKESIKVMTPFSIGGKVVLGQDIYFLGYPSFNNIQFLTKGTIGVLPLVKKGIISGWNYNDAYTLYFLDAHNNPGFSGGPALCIDFDTKKPVIFGVISGYYYEDKPVKNKLKKNEITHIEENAGIVKCYSTETVRQIIASIE